MPKDTSVPTDTGEVKENDTAKDTSVPQPTGKRIRAMQGESPDAGAISSAGDTNANASAVESAPAKAAEAGGGPPATSAYSGHLVPANVYDRIDRARAVHNAEEIAAKEYPHKQVSQLPAKSVQGLAYEGMTQAAVEDAMGIENTEVHPQDLQLRDGRPIKPDIAIKDAEGSKDLLVDAKGYNLKDARTPRAAASSLTHMQQIEHAARYTDVDAASVKGVVFAMPQETAAQPAVQEAVADLGTAERPVSVMAVGNETSMKQASEELAMNSADRGQLPEGLVAEVDRIAGLPVEERREAMGQLMLSQKDKRGNAGLMAAYLQDYGQIERNGAGITIIDDAGEAHTIWYKAQPQT